MMCEAFRSDKHSHFLTIWDNVLTVGVSTRVEERAGQPHPHPEGHLEEAGGGCEK